jgi:hypothetical protein
MNRPKESSSESTQFPLSEHIRWVLFFVFLIVSGTPRFEQCGCLYHTTPSELHVPCKVGHGGILIDEMIVLPPSLIRPLRSNHQSPAPHIYLHQPWALHRLRSPKLNPSTNEGLKWGLLFDEYREDIGCKHLCIHSHF